MLHHLYKKIKSWLEINQKDLFLAAIIILVSIINFGLGRLSAIWPEKQPITFTKNLESGSWNLEDKSKISEPTSKISNSKFQILNSNGRYVASKNSTFYHYPWCPGAQKIKEENKIWFQSKVEAEQKGYKPASNCDGL